MIDKLTPEQKKENEENAKKLCDAIRNFAKSEEHLENFEGYLSYHFDDWMKKYASYPEGLVSEFENFSSMEFYH